MRPEEVANERTIQVWVCDVCKISKFDDFMEACRHEEACGNDHAINKQEPSTTMTKPSSDAATCASKNKSIHAYFSCNQRQPDKNTATVNNPTLTSSRKGNAPARKRKNAKAPIESNFELADPHTKDKPKKPRTGVSRSDVLKATANTFVNLPECDEVGACTSSPTDFALAAIFGTKNYSEIEAEQRAVELIAKRRLADLARQKTRTLAIAPKIEVARQCTKGRNPDQFRFHHTLEHPKPSTKIPASMATCCQSCVSRLSTGVVVTNEATLLLIVNFKHLLLLRLLISISQCYLPHLSFRRPLICMITNSGLRNTR
ncbi:hypothetical protein MHU86_24423 [Fragilaria crotonensis]|nr:hypothetical protein MHU86_24423 [Fragilaria crotonensis]